MINSNLPVQLEQCDVTVADHVVKVAKSNFDSCWEELGNDNETEDTFKLSTAKSLQGEL